MDAPRRPPHRPTDARWPGLDPALGGILRPVRGYFLAGDTGSLICSGPHAEPCRIPAFTLLGRTMSSKAARGIVTVKGTGGLAPWAPPDTWRSLMRKGALRGCLFLTRAALAVLHPPAQTLFLERTIPEGGHAPCWPPLDLSARPSIGNGPATPSRWPSSSAGYPCEAAVGASVALGCGTGIRGSIPAQSSWEMLNETIEAVCAYLTWAECRTTLLWLAYRHPERK